MINIGEKDTILFISGHSDDVELACGGTLAKCVRNRADVHYLALTTPDNSPFVRSEAFKSMRILNVPRENVTILDHPDTAFHTVRQQILGDIESIRDKINPNVVLCPSHKDTHQDHSQTAIETVRAFKKTAEVVLGYDICWGTIVDAFNPRVFVRLSKQDLELKIKAIKCYKSQVKRGYTSSKFHEAQAIVNAGKSSLLKNPDILQYAEGFELYRGVWL